MSKRWSYKVVQVKQKWSGIKPADIEATLAPLGQLGWELVSSVHTGLVVLLYLKKEQ
ncbi:DUF4177 domain-containing protein [Cognatilysobacter tabacisoli]|uniref:DUF4177 domain-containing protein n=1 Tax=Cognatilysobacter tabacisoli TaxID=2315424 RepID=UPI000E6AFCAC|nr:DUF4177 domain-containing protein [Lysobacter tabacisoli]